MKLFFDEKIIDQYDKGNIILTSYRIIYLVDKFENYNFITIPMHKVSSVELQYLSNKKYLIFAGVFVFLSFMLAVYPLEIAVLKGVISGIVVLLSIICILLYLFSRKLTLIITSDGLSKIEFSINGIPNINLQIFIDRIQEQIIQDKYIPKEPKKNEVETP